jgi:pyruvate dehydrogenase E1 component
VGDGEMDEPESLAGLSLAAREGLDNLIVVVNCNLQRLDGPVRGNSSVIQELEGLFAGAGWNVIKLMWGSDWDPLFARDAEGIILKRLHETVDGEFQKYAATDGRFNREHFFNKYPELQKLVAHLSDDDIDRLKRGGHDPVKIYAAYHAAVRHKGQPTVILAQTKKGYGMGTWGQGKMTAHQQKKLEDEALLAFRDRFALPLSDEDVTQLRFYKPAADSQEMKYLHARREALGGYVPARVIKGPELPVPALQSLSKYLEGTGGREQSTTMVFVQMLAQLLRDPALGRNIVPIVADEARTFGMQALFRQVAIYSSAGQLYEPEDRDELLYYKEAKEGQILEEGITEAGAISSWIAAATSYSTHGVPMLPFYIFYSCFGFQRIGDLIWAAGDSRARGFLLGATAGRTTLSGEGLQHEDGSSHILFSTVPNCVAYDPAFGYELTVILQDGMRRMLQEQDDVFYYVTVMNENYAHPAMPAGAEAGILKGMYRVREAQGARGNKSAPRVQLLGAGTILREVLAAAELLEQDWRVAADVWSVTSFTELRREGMAIDRRNRLHPDAEPRRAWVEQCLAPTSGPVIAATDYMRTVGDMIRNWVQRRYTVLGTDGFGRSDTRAALRDFFEVDRHHVAVAALKALADDGTIDRRLVKQAIEKYELDTERANPWDR